MRPGAGGAHPLFPIGVLYDPFVGRALEPWSFGIYAGGQSILVGTPSGVSLAAEGGAHQSIITPSIGIEQPGCTAYEPAFALDLEWCLLDSLARLGRPAARPRICGCPPGRSTSRWRRSRPTCSTGPPPSPRGGRRLPDAPDAGPQSTVAAMGAVLPEALAAADRLDAAGMGCDVSA